MMWINVVQDSDWWGALVRQSNEGSSCVKLLEDLEYLQNSSLQLAASREVFIFMEPAK
jgi:hypothetical protein